MGRVIICLQPLHLRICGLSSSICCYLLLVLADSYSPLLLLSCCHCPFKEIHGLMCLPSLCVWCWAFLVDIAEGCSWCPSYRLFECWMLMVVMPPLPSYRPSCISPSLTISLLDDWFDVTIRAAFRLSCGFFPLIIFTAIISTVRFSCSWKWRFDVLAAFPLSHP